MLSHAQFWGCVIYLAVIILMGGFVLGMKKLCQPSKAEQAQAKALEALIMQELRDADFTPMQAEAINAWAYSQRVGWARVAGRLDLYPIFARKLSDV